MNNSKSFLFLVPLTPSRLMTPLRSLLFEQFLKGLQSQRYENWSAILIGEHEGTEGKVKYCRIMAESKEIKLIFAMQYLLSLEVKPDYIIRMDDDDIINPSIIQKVSTLTFDCFADRYHVFYDVLSGNISTQKRDFLANTVIHKYEHAIKAVGPDQTPLIQSDHSFWIDYYRDKNLVYTAPSFPVYLRVLSPTTVTNGIHEAEGSISVRYSFFRENVTKMKTFADIDIQAYLSYLSTHGKFRYKRLAPFSIVIEHLDAVWLKFSGQKRRGQILRILGLS